jgi:hypothetical protein
MSHLGEDVFVVELVSLVGMVSNTPSATSRCKRFDRIVLASPGIWRQKSRKRVVPLKASRMISNVHLSANTSSERATGRWIVRV